MRKTLYYVMTMALMVPIIVGAVTWQMDSAPFTFPGTGIDNHPVNALQQTNLRYVYSAGKKSVCFHYTLPASIPTAKLSVYMLNGAEVTSFDLHAGKGMIDWNIAKGKIGAGVYMVYMRYGTIEKTIKLSIVK